MLNHVLHLLFVVDLNAELLLEGLSDGGVRYAVHVPIQDELHLFIRVLLCADHDGK